MMTLETLKTHAEAFIATEDAQFKGAWDRFISWAEGKQAVVEADAAKEAEAVAFLTGRGFTVTKA